MKQTHTTTINDDEGEGRIEIEVEVSIAPAERDVGIMSDYIDDWHITSVNGDTSKERCQWAEEKIESEYGDDVFVDKLYDEGACEVDYDDYDDYSEYD